MDTASYMFCVSVITEPQNTSEKVNLEWEERPFQVYFFGYSSDKRWKLVIVLCMSGILQTKGRIWQSYYACRGFFS